MQIHPKRDSLCQVAQVVCLGWLTRQTGYSVLKTKPKVQDCFGKRQNDTAGLLFIQRVVITLWIDDWMNYTITIWLSFYYELIVRSLSSNRHICTFIRAPFRWILQRVSWIGTILENVKYKANVVLTDVFYYEKRISCWICSDIHDCSLNTLDWHLLV